MRKRFAAAVAGLGLMAALAPLGAAANAAECAGLTLFDATYACVVRRDLVNVEIINGGQLRIPQVCAVVTCTEERWLQLPDVDVHDDEVVVLYYNHNCYYVGNASVWSVGASSENDCP